ncbi:cytochrome c maturation protein CcmE [Erythrobacter sp. LQ02-29]|uniref:cytochrome c maturation protein CcmE n=1 Tax=unclassified Erythrobacter TaxID=2633097 RepID=UPI001BFC2103|nr:MULTISPECIES: cytochrome c maturation protein CcmE [unclassified Erythrobacter]MCP9223588.1 cytochrome c maturation protein CcmE [Erythrobacter sp. LQ02-29]QWC57725.1 cytochrome c maturation protein CcmE [Erythrobacter sp. 3-20A1M]
MSALKPKHQRLVLVVIAMVALIGAALLAAWALRSQANYFYLPDQMEQNPPAPGQAVRLGGMVQRGSVKQMADGVSITFTVGGRGAIVPVRYSGIVPDLFTEGSGVVAEGSLGRDGVFTATNLLAKHDENYTPREMQGLDDGTASKMARDTTVGL